MPNSIYYVAIVLFAGPKHVISQSFIDDLCIDKSSGASGTCQRVEDCQSAIESIEKYQKFPQTCGFEGSIPVVCCIGNGGKGTTSRTTTTRSTPITTTRATAKLTARPTATIPTIRPTPTTSILRTGDKSKQKCIEYGQYVYVTEPPPNTLSGTQLITKDMCQHKVVPLIGESRARLGEFPHMALVGFDGDLNKKIWLCSGTLISENFVLTAGHCVSNRIYGSAKYLRIGDSNDGSQPQEFNITVTFSHPDFKPSTSYNDIGLLKTDRPVRLNPFIRPACLYTSRTLNTEKPTATGWEKTDFSENADDVFSKVTLEYVDHQTCNNSYKNYITRRLKMGIVDDTQICTGVRNGKFACQGDSGGPLQVYNKEVYCTYSIIGVSSFGKECGITNQPEVFTRVSSFIQWIENIVWP